MRTFYSVDSQYDENSSKFKIFTQGHFKYEVKNIYLLKASVQRWVFYGEYTGVMKQSIYMDSIFLSKRDRTFWTKLFNIRDDGIVSPLLIRHITCILTIGRSINLLKV